MSELVPTAGPVYRTAAATAFGLMRLQRWRFDVSGFEHVPARGGAVLASNHTSFWDHFTVGHEGYRRYGRPVRILAKESLFRTPVFGWIMRRAEHIPVHRGAGRDALASAVEALRTGELVLVLPEQTISRSFDLLPFKTGAARMAAAARVPLVPSVSWGTHRFHTAGRLPAWSWRLPVTVRYGEPLHPAPDDDPEEVTRELRARVVVLLEEAVRAYADGTPAGAWWVPARHGGAAPAHDEVVAELAQRERTWRRPTIAGDDARG